MNIKRFEKVVAEAIDALPEKFREKMDNVDVIVENNPSEELLKQQGIFPAGTLLGLYHGVPLGHRGRGYSSVLPDTITIYREPIERLCANENQIRKQVRGVFLHELGHHFGMTEQDLA